MLRIIEALYELLGVEKQKGENSPAQRVKYIMAKLDENQNGSLNEQEFIQGCLSNRIFLIFNFQSFCISFY